MKSPDWHPCSPEKIMTALHQRFSHDATIVMCITDSTRWPSSKPAVTLPKAVTIDMNDGHVVQGSASISPMLSGMA
jgi:hypothetical protein